jgi:Histidine kinase-, DNA gyrase B-, and HSP90-like ATPase
MVLGSPRLRPREHDQTVPLLSPRSRNLVDTGRSLAAREGGFAMFRVENADFIADKIASELLPNQEIREVMKNAQEALERRVRADEVADGRIEFDVDWPMLEATGQWFVCCADNGDGMSRIELERYMTTLAVQGASKNQSLSGNQGMGLKISGPPRHRRGVLIRSLKNGERTMIQVGWNGQEYDLIPIGQEDDEKVVSVEGELFPAFIREKGSGTVITFLGNSEGDNTFAPADRPRGWLFKYLHQRFFRLSDDGTEVVVRVPSGDEEDWPRTLAEALDRHAGRGKSFNLSKVRGTASVWDDAADRQGDGFRGSVELPGDAATDVPAARMHWWVLPGGPGTDVSTRTASGGSIALLYQNELHDWRTASQANPFFARLGVLFGKPRITFVLEPLGSTIRSDTARAHVLVGGKPVFESDAWLVWSEQFRAQLPEAIKRTMTEEQARLQEEDPDRARRIRERLKDVMALLRPRRFRRQPEGRTRAAGPTATGPDGGLGSVIERSMGPGRRPSRASARGIGAVLTQIEPAGEPATDIFSILDLEPRWVTEAEAETFTIVNGNSAGLHDRAAALVGEDGATARILLLNREFRGYQAILGAVNDWANPEGDDDKAAAIETSVQEWVEQKMVEAVNGLRQLENGSTWLASHFDDALSPVGLTTAFMADRYHTLREVKRAAGGLRARPVSAGAKRSAEEAPVR